MTESEYSLLVRVLSERHVELKKDLTDYIGAVEERLTRRIDERSLDHKDCRHEIDGRLSGHDSRLQELESRETGRAAVGGAVKGAGRAFYMVLGALVSLLAIIAAMGWLG